MRQLKRRAAEEEEKEEEDKYKVKLVEDGDDVAGEVRVSESVSERVLFWCPRARTREAACLR